MKTLHLLMLCLVPINSLKRYRRSCSTDLQSAFASLINSKHLIISVPEEEQKIHVHQLPSIYNQPCNQQDFYINLKHETFLHKHRHNPTFLLKPSYQSPENRCFTFSQQNCDLQGPSTLSPYEFPQAVLHLSLDYGTPNQVKNIPNENHSKITQLIFPRDADVFIYIFYIITSFYERHNSIRYSLRTIPTVPDSALRTRPCYVKLTDLPNITHVQYSETTENIDATNIHECDLTAITTIRKTAFNTFHVTFPGGKLTSIVPRNAEPNRLYYKREATHPSMNPTPWFELTITTGSPRQKPQNLIRILPSANSHLVDHKFLFVPPALRPRHTTITYQHGLEFIYNSNFTQPLISSNYPAAITTKLPTHNHQYRYVQHNQCVNTALHKNVYPFGTHEIELLNILPPPNSKEFCKNLPDPNNPVQSYISLEQNLTNYTMINHTWFSWSAELDNHSHPNQTSLLEQSPYLDQILHLYKNFTPAYNEYTTKLHHAQINKQFATFNLYYYAQEMQFKQSKNLSTLNTQANQQIAANELFTSQQLITLYAKRLWKIHFIRQNLLQKALLIWKTRRFLKTISNFRNFKKDVVYEHKLVKDKIYSWNRLLVLGDRDYEHRFTIPDIDPEQTTYWNPAKLTALFGGAIAVCSALAYGAYNLFFAGSTIRSDQSFYAQVSLHTINNQSLPLP